MQKTLVSIVIPIYNVEKTIKKCLDSIQKQTYQNIEILCIDDCSPDKSASIVMHLQKSDPRIKYFTYKKNRGSGGARDFGIRHAKGSYIFFVDADDFIDPIFIEQYMRESKNGFDIIAGGYIHESPKHTRRHMPSSAHESPWIDPSPCTKAFKLSFLKEHNIDFRNVRYYEDVIFNYRCLSNNPKLKIINYCGYHYIMNNESNTRSGNPERKYATYAKSHYDFFIEDTWKRLDQEQKDCLEYAFYQHLTIGMLVNIHHAGTKAAHNIFSTWKTCIDRTFPNYLDNRYVKSGGPNCEQPHIKRTLKVFNFSQKIKLTHLLTWILSK